MTRRFLDDAPPEAWGPPQRTFAVRKKPGFEPAVQRWSFRLPDDCAQLRVAFLGAQGPDDTTIEHDGFADWIDRQLVGHASGPTVVDRARFTDPQGLRNHVVAAYGGDEARHRGGRDDPAVRRWWDAPDRVRARTGIWQEILRVPRDRQESIYWRDYPAGLMRSDAVDVYPTPYCGYYGAMRDRIPLAAVDPLDGSPDAVLAPRSERVGFGQRWRIVPPHDLAVIRSANTWGRMDDGQLADYRAHLSGPLEQGMAFLREAPVASGCASLRMMRTHDERGVEVPEDHALGHFLSLRHMERWAEGHATHAAIFGAAISRYRRYGASNQLRTWHEVFILPEGDQRFEYVNCHPATGLLRWFDGERLDG
jgi:hypothetical protein